MRFLLLLLTLSVLVALPVSAQQRAPSLPPVYLGGVPVGTPSPEPLALTILDAINRGLQHNLGLITAQENADRANGTRRTALSDLRPNVFGRVSEYEQVVNLEAFGFPLPPGFPPIVGPFNVFDARVFASQSIVDLHAFGNARAEAHNVAAAQHTVRSARDIVVLVTANAYLQALAAGARVESARAQMQSADAIFRQASNMRENGLAAGIDVLRAEVQLATERQRVTAASNDLEKSKLQLARIIGLPTGQALTLVDELPYVPAPDITLEAALDQAYKTRPDYLAALERVHAAEANRRAVVGELWPSVRVSADWGVIGLTAADSEPTYTILGAVVVPFFNGGRTRGRLAEADADLRQRRAEAEDAKAGIYYDVRTAFLDLQSTNENLQVATRARDLASQQLTQARDRFAAGVTNNVEVVQAQEAVAEANEQYIGALYGFNVAKALLARGLGIAESATRQLLGGRP